MLFPGYNDRVQWWIKQLRIPSYFLWVIGLGVVLRIAWAMGVPVIPVADSHAYDVFAQNLAACQNYGWDCSTPTAYWPVGTSFLYSILYKLFGHHYVLVTGLNVLLAIATIFLSMYLSKLWFGRQHAVVTGLLLALWPSQIQFVTVLASEQLFTALTLATLAIWISESINLWQRATIVGILLAAGSYVRPTALMIPALFLFLRYIQTREIVRSLVAVLIVFITMSLLIAPWSVRNTQAFGQFVMISTNGGANLWMGNNPNSTGEYMELPQDVEGMNEAQRDQYLKQQAIAHIKEYPLLFAARTVKRLVDTHSRESIAIAWNEAGLVDRYGRWILTPLKILNQCYWMSMLGLGAIGIGLLAQRSGWLTISHPAVLMWGYFTAVHAVIVAQDRYHFPSIPMIAILSGFAVVQLLDKRSRPN